MNILLKGRKCLGYENSRLIQMRKVLMWHRRENHQKKKKRKEATNATPTQGLMAAFRVQGEMD